MVAKISTPLRLLSALNYNENKVSNGKATCIYAGGFLRDAADLNFTQKLLGFERLNVRNERAETKTLHVSLNFDPSEKLSDDRLQRIADAYLTGIGFNGQPYLVYRHTDAGHPHIHIVTSTIREDGSRINTHNIGRNQSEATRKEIEIKFGLVKAGKNSKQQSIIPPINTAIQYGKTETREALNRVVTFVTNNYLFASLPELNAILQTYNVRADRGSEDSRVCKHRGLNYHLLDANGKAIGIPIKASALSRKPTLARLEEMFQRNQPEKEKFKKNLKSRIDQAVDMHPKDLHTLKENLRKSNVELVLRQSSDGRVYGLTFVDQNNQVVFNGSDLGKNYSAVHLQKRLTANPQALPEPSKQIHPVQTTQNELPENITALMLQPENEFNPMPGGLRKKKRKRKRRNLGL